MTQKRKPRKLLEAEPKQWERWEHFRKLEGVTFATFARRALEQRCASLSEIEELGVSEPAVRVRLPGKDWDAAKVGALGAVVASRVARFARRVRKTSPKKRPAKRTKKVRRSRG